MCACALKWIGVSVDEKPMALNFFQTKKAQKMGRLIINHISLWHLFSFAVCWKHGVPSRAAIIRTRATAAMNASSEYSFPEERIPGNSTWAYSYHQNYTLSPPLLPGKTNTSKAAACEQLHIAVEVWVACVALGGQTLLLCTLLHFGPHCSSILRC